jgi:hypothetical protein
LSVLAFGGAAFSQEQAQPPSFAGKWSLDIDASDTMVPIMQALGRSKMEQKMAGNMAVTQTITQTVTQMTIAIKSMVKNQTEVLLLDGTKETRDTPNMGMVQTYTSWDKDGKTLVTIADMTLKNGDPAEMVMRRQLQDNGQTMLLQNELRLKDGQVLTANRIFRKA